MFDCSIRIFKQSDSTTQLLYYHTCMCKTCGQEITRKSKYIGTQLMCAHAYQPKYIHGYHERTDADLIIFPIASYVGNSDDLSHVKVIYYRCYLQNHTIACRMAAE